MIQFPNVYQNFEYKNPQLKGQGLLDVDMKGKWGQKHFENDKPISLELACGRGEYTLALARKYPERNFIGVDIKGARIYKGASKALEEELNNVAFLRTKIELIRSFIGDGEISDIWITFPDPFLRKSKSNRRLTSPRFLNLYRHILKSGSKIRLKTDSRPLYEFTLEVLENIDWLKLTYQNDDIYSGPLYDEALEIKTYYERMHLENKLTIKYIEMQLLEPV